MQPLFNDSSTDDSFTMADANSSISSRKPIFKDILGNFSDFILLAQENKYLGILGNFSDFIFLFFS